MLRFILLLLSATSSLLLADDSDYKFAGKHFLASYMGCDLEAIGDVEGMLRAMDLAVKASGATILDEAHYTFPPNGLTVVYLLSESHASLHTYPEHGACFVDLFTCGDRCSAEKFDEALRSYLKPQEVSSRLFLRHEGVEEARYVDCAFSDRGNCKTALPGKIDDFEAICEREQSCRGCWDELNPKWVGRGAAAEMASKGRFLQANEFCNYLDKEPLFLFSR